jgi:hypothetical protein
VAKGRALRAKQPRHEVVRVELVHMNHAGPNAFSARIYLTCGHYLVRKASAYRGKTASCWQCPEIKPG